MSYYPEDVIEEVRVSNDIVSVVSEYIRLGKKGANFFGLCPFHREKTPSFCVSASKQIFTCFGCGKGGNVIQFIMYIENYDFIDALKYLAERAGVVLPEEQDSRARQKTELRKSIIKINTEAARFFYSKINEKTAEKARNYLLERGINSETQTKFGIGYSFEEWDLLYKYLIDAGYDEKIILKSGLIIRSKNGNYIDRFRGRVMFPIFDIRGNVIGFGGRIIGTLEGPKYMNSPESVVYNKRKNLYAINFARSTREKSIIVVEGYMDVISLHQYGIKNAVASLGTSLTVDQARLMKKYFEEIIISYDSDTAGKAATIRGLDILSDIGCSVKVVMMPEGDDPDEYIHKYGIDAYKKLVNNSYTLVEYKIKILEDDINTEKTEGRIEFLNKCADILSKIDNRVERETYTVKLAEKYSVSKEALSTEVYKRIKPGQRLKRRKVDLKDAKVVNDNEEVHKNSKIEYYERILISLLCMDNSVYRTVKENLSNHCFAPENQKAAQFVCERLENGKDLVPAELMNFLESDIAAKFVRVMQEDCNCEDIEKGVMDIIKRIEICKFDKRKKEIIQLLSNKDKIEGNVEKLNQELKSIIIKTQLLKKGGIRK